MRDNADKVASRTPNAHATAELADLAPGVCWTRGVGTHEQYDLVLCLYVHVAGSVQAMVQRLARGVAPGGTLFMVGHRPIDPATGKPTAAANQVQVSVADAVVALGAQKWEFVVAEERQRASASTGVDAVIRARRRPA